MRPRWIFLLSVLLSCTLISAGMADEKKQKTPQKKAPVTRTVEKKRVVTKETTTTTVEVEKSAPRERVKSPARGKQPMAPRQQVNSPSRTKDSSAPRMMPRQSADVKTPQRYRVTDRWQTDGPKGEVRRETRVKDGIPRVSMEKPAYKSEAAPRFLQNKKPEDAKKQLTKRNVAGTVESISDGKAVIRTEDGRKALVQLGPDSYLEKKGYRLNPGDRVSVDGYGEWGTGGEMAGADGFFVAGGIYGPGYYMELCGSDGYPYWADPYDYWDGWYPSWDTFYVFFWGPPPWWAYAPPPPWYYGPPPPWWGRHHHPYWHNQRYCRW